VPIVTAPGTPHRAASNRSRFAFGGLCLAGSLLLAMAAQAASFGVYKADVKPADVFPGAERFGPVEGSPPAAAAYKNGKIAGYVFETSDTGYSGKPIKILAGLDLDGTITGAKVTEHHEPILLIGIPQERLFEFVGRYVGRNVIDIAKQGQDGAVDIISGATVTAVVINDGLPRQALAMPKPTPPLRRLGSAARNPTRVQVFPKRTSSTSTWRFSASRRPGAPCSAHRTIPLCRPSWSRAKQPSS
jgi:transcriptional regulator of nitric oxide reductase